MAHHLGCDGCAVAHCGRRVLEEPGGKRAAFDPSLLTKVTRGDLEVAVTELGKIEPREKVAVKSKVAGQVEKILIEEGMPVKSGQLLLFWTRPSFSAAWCGAAGSRQSPSLARFCAGHAGSQAARIC